MFCFANNVGITHINLEGSTQIFTRFCSQIMGI